MKRLLSFLLALFAPIQSIICQETEDGSAVNFSVRAELNGKPLIHGLAVEGSQNVLFRAIGTSLGAQGVNTAIDDPCLILYDSDGNEVAQTVPVAVLAQQEFQLLTSAVEASGAFPVPSFSTEAVMIYPVSGPMTLHAKSISGKIGEMLIETYTLPSDLFGQNDSLTGSPSQQLTKIQPLIGENPESLSDGAKIMNSTLVGNLVSITAEFSGGCENHHFGLYYDLEHILRTNEFGATDSSVKIYLEHRAPGDPCDAIVQQNLLFDLSPMFQHIFENYQNPQFISIDRDAIVGGSPAIFSLGNVPTIGEITLLETTLPGDDEDLFYTSFLKLDDKSLIISAASPLGSNHFQLFAESNFTNSTPPELNLYMTHDHPNGGAAVVTTTTFYYNIAELLTLHDNLIGDRSDFILSLFSRIKGENELISKFTVNSSALDK
ncbi:hypothetical protein MLD52_14360 [Puniceicoccaceae bacterium K14]|nr:hypothetical protein [Puniceicoccaceae bacterium K14]